MSGCCDTRIVQIPTSNFDITGASIDFEPTGNPGEYTVSLGVNYNDAEGNPQTVSTVDPTPVQIGTLNVNAGDTAAVGDASQGAATVLMGETIHFHSTDDTVTFAVSEGSAIVDVQVNQANLPDPVTITGINFAPTANPNEYTVSVNWTDGAGAAQTTTDATPVTIEGTSGTVQNAPLALITTNGTTVAVGEPYVQFPDGTTWAAEPAAHYANTDLTTTGARNHSFDHNVTENHDGASQQRNFEVTAVAGLGTHDVTESVVGRDVNAAPGNPNASRVDETLASGVGYDRDVESGAAQTTVDHRDGSYVVQAQETNTSDQMTGRVEASTNETSLRYSAQDAPNTGIEVGVAGKKALDGDTELFVSTRDVGAGTAVAGQVLTLVDAATGEVEYQDLPSSQVPDVACFTGTATGTNNPGTFVAPYSGDFTFTLDVASNEATFNAGFTVGSGVSNTNLYASGGTVPPRIDQTDPVRAVTLTLVGGTTYNVNRFTGGGSTIADLRLTVADEAMACVVSQLAPDPSAVLISTEEGNLLITGDDGNLYAMPLQSETCYIEVVDAVEANTEFTIDQRNLDTVPFPTALPGGGNWFQKANEVVFDPTALPLGTRFKGLTLSFGRFGNNTTAAVFNYKGQGITFGLSGTANNSTTQNANGVRVDFGVSQIVDATSVVATNVTSNNKTDERDGPAYDFIASATGGFLNSLNDNTGGAGTPKVGLNAAFHFELSTIVNHTVRTYSDGETTKLVEFVNGEPTELASIPTTWVEQSCESPEWLSEECYDVPTGTFDFSGPTVTEANGSMTQASGAVAPGSAPFRIQNNGPVPILLQSFSIRYGANGYTGTGAVTILGETFNESGQSDVSGVYRTVEFSPANGVGVEFPVPSGHNSSSGSNHGALTGGFQGPVITNNPGGLFPAGNVSRAELNYVVGVEVVEQRTVRTYVDGTMAEIVNGELVPLTVIPSNWTPCTTGTVTNPTANVEFPDTGSKVAVFTGDIDVTGTIDPDGIVFNEGTAAPYSDVATAQTYFTGKGYTFENTLWVNPADGHAYRGAVDLEDYVQSVTGTQVDNTDPANPVVNEPTCGNVTIPGFSFSSPVSGVLASNGQVVVVGDVYYPDAESFGFGLSGSLPAGGGYVSLQVGSAPGLADVFDGDADGFNNNDVSSAGGGSGTINIPSGGRYYFQLVRSGSTNLGGTAGRTVTLSVNAANYTNLSVCAAAAMAQDTADEALSLAESLEAASAASATPTAYITSFPNVVVQQPILSANQAVEQDTVLYMDAARTVVDTAAFNIQGAQLGIEVLAAGDYNVDAYLRVGNPTGGNLGSSLFNVTATGQGAIMPTDPQAIAAGESARWAGSGTVTLSAGDVINLGAGGIPSSFGAEIEQWSLRITKVG